jgi:hypothetical protein
MDLIEVLVSELQEHASAVPDPEHGPEFVMVDGMVDVGALAAHVLEHAAYIVDTYRVPSASSPSGTRAALPSEVRDHLTALARAARYT